MKISLIVSFIARLWRGFAETIQWKRCKVLAVANDFTTSEPVTDERQGGVLKRHSGPTSMKEQIAEEISRRWEVRFNVLTNNLEVCDQRQATGVFEPATERVLNSMVMAVQEVYPACYRSWVTCYLFSEAILSYNPLRHYLTTLPPWDGKDHVGRLAARVSDDPLWIDVWRRWMRAMVAGWLHDGKTPTTFANQMAPLLVSERQGMRKSTFCRLLLPLELRRFYLDKFDLTADSHAERQMGCFAMINMDEFDRYSERQMATLKNLMQLTSVAYRRPRARALTEEARIASFIGTSNCAELLTDPTGSRRFYCQIVNEPIDCSPIPYPQVYAQLMAELNQGLPTYFSKAEEQAIEAHNLTFYRRSPLSDIFSRVFVTIALPNEEGVEWLTMSEIFETLKRAFPKALQGITVTRMGRELRLLGVIKRRTPRHNLYAVRRIEDKAA